jgi:hypothetical protein
MGSFRSIRRDTPLSDELIASVAPSIFATAAHASRSDRYAYIPTSDVLNGLRREGFMPFAVAQSNTRKADRREHTRHMIRLRHADNINNAEAAHEIVLLNSHDGTSSYQMLSGMFRFVCANGLVCGDIENDIRVRHKGDIRDQVIEGAFTVLSHQDKAAAAVDTMRSLSLSLPEQLAFARAARVLRYGEEHAPITDAQVLEPKRSEDVGNDLWRVFNRTEENLTKGGMDGRTVTGKIRAQRAVTGLDQNTKLNRALWTLAQEMAALKAA